MAGFNKVILIGNLTRDPELKYTPQGTATTEFRIAVNTRMGKDREDVLYKDVVVFGKEAEAANTYLSKGRICLVEGRLKQDTWKDKSGNTKTSEKVVANPFGVVFLRDNGTQQSSPARQPSNNTGYPNVDNEFDASEEVPF